MTRSSPRASTRALYMTVTLTLAACQDGGELASPAAPSLSDPFVPVYRQTPSDVMERRQALTAGTGATGITEAPGQDFYLAIHKKELGSRWFMAAYMTQAAPQGAASGAARSLGTRVVSFKVQNGKLFVFDAGDHNASSDPFRPELVLEAYPIVQGYGPFERQKGSSDYVLFDPAAGLNRFRLLQDAGVPLEVDLSFSQRFRKIGDGATFEQVFSGTTRTAPQPGAVPGRVTGTLSLALRRYAEGEGYTEVAMPAREHYFRSPSRIIVDEGRTGFVAARWNIKPGGPPILWKIAPLGEKLRQHPAFADVDFTGAIKAGIESWNEAFGWKALEARVADPDESFGDDDVNYYIFDSLRSTASAFANWRSNPNTGEIRGASVWFALGWLRATMDLPPSGAPAPVVGSGEPSEGSYTAVSLSDDRRPAGLAWGTASDESLCDLELARPGRGAGRPGDAALHPQGTHRAAGGAHRRPRDRAHAGAAAQLQGLAAAAVELGDGIHRHRRFDHLRRAHRQLRHRRHPLPLRPVERAAAAAVLQRSGRRRGRPRLPPPGQGRAPAQRLLPAPVSGVAAAVPRRGQQLVSGAQQPGPAHPAGGVTGGAAGGLPGDVRPAAGAAAAGDADPTFVSRLNFVTQLALRQLFLDPQPGQPTPAGQPAPGALPPSRRW